MKKQVICLVIGVLVTLSSTVFASISVSPMHVEFLPNKPKRHAIQVYNRSNKVAYVSVTPYAMHYAKSGKATRTEIKNPAQSGLIISPARLIVPAGQRRQVRLVLTKPLDKEEEEFQLVVRPEKGKFIAKSSGVNVVVAYSVRVLAAPRTPKPNIKVVRDGKKVVIENQGNTGVRIEKVQQCPNVSKGEDAPQCVQYKQANRRLPVQTTYSFELERAAPVTLTQRYHNNAQVLESN